MSRMTRPLAGAAVLAAAALLAAGCGSGFSSNNSQPAQKTGPVSLQILIASSGDAETAAVKQAAAAWAKSSGNKATVTPAQNIDQQLGQAFAGSAPPDVFYLDAAKVADYASVGALYPYGNKVNNPNDFYPTLRAAFTYKGTFYCAPKDFSTLGLVINTDLWTKAGLTNADLPTTWDQFTADLQKLKAKGIVPLAVSPTHDRVDAFIKEAGGSIVDKSGKPDADSPQNVQALTYVQGLLKQGLMKYSSQLDTGWGGEALGTGKAAITIEGNWIEGAMKSDYPKIKYEIAAMPSGPAGPGTLEFTQCWGVSAKSKNHAADIAFVNAMTAPKQQLAFAKAFGVIPSRQSAQATYEQQFPTDKAFLAGAPNGVGPVNAPKVSDVLADYDTQLTQLAKTSPSAVLQRLQTNLTSALGG
ncbi:MAG TPA: extracellular solute-binding protein [Pseudonocardiaceae bacterium]|nr:extracellular solute-binding protein [Pseudonocardiaceae bacterium]